MVPLDVQIQLLHMLQQLTDEVDVRVGYIVKHHVYFYYFPKLYLNNVLHIIYYYI